MTLRRHRQIVAIVEDQRIARFEEVLEHAGRVPLARLPFLRARHITENLSQLSRAARCRGEIQLALAPVDALAPRDANAARLMAPRAKIVGRTVRARQVDPAHPAPRTRCDRIIIPPIPALPSAFPFPQGQHLNAAAPPNPPLSPR